MSTRSDSTARERCASSRPRIPPGHQRIEEGRFVATRILDAEQARALRKFTIVSCGSRDPLGTA